MFKRYTRKFNVAITSLSRPKEAEDILWMLFQNARGYVHGKLEISLSLSPKIDRYYRQTMNVHLTGSKECVIALENIMQHGWQEHIRSLAEKDLGISIPLEKSHVAMLYANQIILSKEAAIRQIENMPHQWPKVYA